MVARVPVTPLWWGNGLCRICLLPLMILAWPVVQWNAPKKVRVTNALASWNNLIEPLLLGSTDLDNCIPPLPFSPTNLEDHHHCASQSNSRLMHHENFLFFFTTKLWNDLLSSFSLSCKTFLL